MSKVGTSKTEARKPGAKKPVPRRTALANQVRIIGGQWKRTPLPVLAAEGLRPTPDRVRETVFNWLTHLRDGDWKNVVCLDLFAGTGALGFEAASRGAQKVILVESSSAAVAQMEANKEKLQANQVSIMRGDALTIVQRLGSASHFDLIFLDPPYHQDWLAKLLPACVPLLAPSAVVYVEAEASLLDSDAPEWVADWHVIRADRAGSVFYHLLQRKSAPTFEA